MQETEILLKFPSLTATTAQVQPTTMNLTSDYWVHSSQVTNQLTDEDTVVDFLDDSKNINLANDFFTYLKSNTSSEEEFQNILYDNLKLSNVLNDYYYSTIVNNSVSNSDSISNAVKNTIPITYKNLNFNESNIRINTGITELIDVYTGDSLYIEVIIKRNNNIVSPVSFEEFTNTVYESGITYTQGFVNLNQDDEAFKPYESIEQVLNVSSASSNASVNQEQISAPSSSQILNAPNTASNVVINQNITS